VLLDGEVVIDNSTPVRGDTFFGRGSIEVEAAAELTAGESYRIEIEVQGSPRGATWMSGVDLTAKAPDDNDALDRAIAAATDADVALVVVGGELPDSEGHDRRSIDLPAEHEELIRAVAAVNPKTVVLVNSGAPMKMDWADDVAAVAQLWYLGQEAGAAVADVLFGDTDAAGRLPTTFPRDLEDTPAFPFYPGSYGRTRYGEGVLVGHRHYEAHTVEPRFCFGHGLSYTEFRYGELTLETGDGGYPSVSVDVTNVGERAGCEVVQVYVRDMVSSVVRPERELKEFRKLRLEPGETQTVRFDLPRRAFAFWDVGHHNWFVEPGEFEIAVGSSSRAIRATVNFDLPGFV
jgi:beta-glucosidase